MKKIVALIIAALFLLYSAAEARTTKRSTLRSFTGVVTHVTDGDTIWVKSSRGDKAIDVRIQGVDAPEMCQDYGRTAQAALAKRALHQTVSVTSKTKDKYGRVVGVVQIGGEDIGAWLVTSGHAWSYHSTRSLGPYKQEEAAARQAGRGLWGSNRPIEPRVFRRRNKCKH